MTPIVDYRNRKEQINIAPIYHDTNVELVQHNNNYIVIIQNHQMIALINAPIMKIVRAIRTIQPNAKLTYVS